MRIAVGGFHLEASTYNPNVSAADEFIYLRGRELQDDLFFSALKDFDAEVIPILYARAVPGAPMESCFYRDMKADFLERLQAASPLDGVYLSLHGACFVDGLQDAEGDFIEAVRDTVGPDCPISASYDLHGNVSQRVIDNLNAFSAYRTAPHVDQYETMRRALTMLTRMIRTGEKPKLCWCPIPVVLQGERTVTTCEPGASLYKRLFVIEKNKAIWDASLMVGYVWADEPRITAAAILTGTDEAALTDEAQKLAQAYFDARNDFKFNMETGTVDDCIRRAITSEAHPVFISDSGDNVTAGGPGDRTDILKALIALEAQNVIIAGIVDRPATTAAYEAGEGATIAIKIGGNLVPYEGAPVAFKCKVITLLQTTNVTMREAVIQTGGIKIVLTASRKAFTNIDDYDQLGLDLASTAIVVVKLGYLFSQLVPVSKLAIMALSEGIVDQDIERLPRQLTPKPTFPFQTGFEFEPKVAWSKATA